MDHIEEFPLRAVDQNKVLDVYLGISTGSDASGTGASHYFIMADIRGESSGGTVRGMEYHLYLPKRGKSMVVGFVGFRGVRSTEDTRLVPLGKIPTTIPYGPSGDLVDCLDPRALRGWIDSRFSHFINVECGGETMWGSVTNCQRYARFLAQDLQLEWPADVTVSSDYYPFAVDIYANLQESTITSKNTL
eukprot:gene20881-25076_t